MTAGEVDALLAGSRKLQLATLNQDGTSIYLSLSTMFIAQAYGIDLSVTQQTGLVAIMMITSKGVGGVSGGNDTQG